MIADQLILNKKESKTTYEEDKTSEKPLRSIAKAFSWRVIGTLDTMVLYFFHERIWNLVKWGK